MIRVDGDLFVLTEINFNNHFQRGRLPYATHSVILIKGIDQNETIIKQGVFSPELALMFFLQYCF